LDNLWKNSTHQKSKWSGEGGGEVEAKVKVEVEVDVLREGTGNSRTACDIMPIYIYGNGSLAFRLLYDLEQFG
jgi:hypothetical protein